MKQVRGYITRKTMLYKTGVEYGNYCMNHVLGCAHGCKYPCYAMNGKIRFGIFKTYGEWIQPYLVKNTLELIDKEIPRLKNKIETVHLCFSTDPFMYGYDEVIQMSLAAIKKLNDAGIKCTVLTKGVLPIELADYLKDNVYGITLISMNEAYREQYEPGAAKYEDRIKALRYLHDAGCKTWASIEPYPTPNILKQELKDILERVKFVDKIIFGRTNYNKIVSSYPGVKDFYNTEAKKVIAFCKMNKIDWHIKKGTMTTC